ncbi:MAG: bifunctional homocysteine S-methyltransferase/methylenetetrahydrofolate reductase [Deltaproteobacteria bacterium RIFOXYA12_FULL_58_15]|nr:MAG: bifunctional homocysteine S-methyltransferase/methylenetetrahydrofolate reductase [Deltaproteobacteria bacterium RIFOXYA12_FULL_58_15]
MPNSLFDEIAERVVVADGGIGTLLYAKGVYVNQCYDMLNLTAPDTVRDIHRDYIKAGSELIETNTFGANPLKLEPHGQAANTEEINKRGAELARDAVGDKGWVGGSVGPLGKRLSPIGKISVAEAIELFRPQIKGLVAGGVDLIVIETMGDIKELTAAVQAARLECGLPILTMATFPAEGRTIIGYTPEEVMTAMTHLGVQSVGANCSEGPHDMLATIEQLKLANPEMPIAAMPNAGSPRLVDDRVLYMASPDYFAEYSRRFIQAGTSLVGGCCGTTPDHIRAVCAMVRALKPAKQVVTSVEPLEKATQLDPAPIEERSPLGAKLARQSVLGNRFVVSVEMNPPRGHDVTKALAAAETLRFHGVDVINIPDGPRASARMSSLHLALLIEQRVGMETVLHYTCRDRNLLGMQADLLGAYALGLRNVLAITGDPPKLGDYPNVTAVYDVESIGLVRAMQGLNRGIDLAANPIGEPCKFLIGVGANPGAADFDREIRRFRYKVEAGANFCMTQPVYEPALLERFLKAINDCRVPVLVGILPLASYRNAEFLHNEVPGMQIPEPIRKRMGKSSEKNQGGNEGIAIAQEALLATRQMVDGVYIMPPFGRIDSALRVLEVLR